MRQKEEFTRQFRELQTKFSKFYAVILNRAHLTLPQYALLSSLVYSGLISMTEVSSKLHITKPAVTSLVDRLERKKYLKRLAHGEDRRVTLLELSTKGERIVHNTQGRVLHFLLSALDQFNQEEQETILRFYSVLSKKMEDMMTPHLEISAR